ncbi:MULTISPECIES: YdcF family protein [Prochlorococcus]|uniref:YdcF family protein n=1 Tax=Prochlorococcus TaxID=1218 RepID=UPI00053398FA|nr:MULTISPECIES: YdcF family protein [Prochlorococcus]KGG10315.1 putative transmembrane protein [Prochlorococcus marinus str. LG]KGG24249.1 putative transmembrane protein [Prochlorococcus marinus str. SS35]
MVSQMLWKFVEHPWQRIDESHAPTADAIVVLSSGGRSLAPGISNIIEWNDPDRFLAGVKLFKEKKAPKLFFTGGASPYRKALKTEGDLYKEEAISLGIPKKAISTTGRVFNTAEEAFQIRRNIKDKGSPSKILLVTSAFHMQRAKRQFERQGFIVQPFPVDFKTERKFRKTYWKNPYNWIPNSESLFMSSKALRELLGRAVYRSW